MRIDVTELHFWEMGTAYDSYSKSAPSVQWTPLLAVTAEYVWVTVQTKVNRCISPRKGGKKREVESKTEWEQVRERKDWEMKVAAWHRECDSVMQTGFIVSPQRPREIISSQYGVYQSSQNTTLPSRYMSRLSTALSVYLSVCLHGIHRCTFGVMKIGLVGNAWYFI